MSIPQSSQSEIKKPTFDQKFTGFSMSFLNYIFIPLFVLGLNLFSLLKIFIAGDSRGWFLKAGKKMDGNTIFYFLFEKQNYIYIGLILLIQLSLLFLAAKLQDKEKRKFINFNQIFLGLFIVPILLMLVFVLLISVSSQIITNS